MIAKLAFWIIGIIAAPIAWRYYRSVKSDRDWDIVTICIVVIGGLFGAWAITLIPHGWVISIPTGCFISALCLYGSAQNWLQQLYLRDVRRSLGHDNDGDDPEQGLVAVFKWMRQQIQERNRDRNHD